MEPPTVPPMSRPADRLDDLIDAAIARERQDLSWSPGQPLPPEAEERVREALRFLAEGYYTRSHVTVRALLPYADADPRIPALDAACRSLVSGRLRPGMETCMGLLERRSHLPDLYCILGVLLLKSKQRAEAHAVFRSGLRLAPGHGILRAGLERMGVRRRPVLSFLPRSHPANRWLGRVRSWMGGRSD